MWKKIHQTKEGVSYPISSKLDSTLSWYDVLGVEKWYPLNLSGMECSRFRNLPRNANLLRPGSFYSKMVSVCVGRGTTYNIKRRESCQDRFVNQMRRTRRKSTSAMITGLSLMIGGLVRKATWTSSSFAASSQRVVPTAWMGIVITPRNQSVPTFPRPHRNCPRKIIWIRGAFGKYYLARYIPDRMAPKYYHGWRLWQSRGNRKCVAGLVRGRNKRGTRGYYRLVRMCSLSSGDGTQRPRKSKVPREFFQCHSQAGRYLPFLVCFRQGGRRIADWLTLTRRGTTWVPPVPSDR